MSQRKYIINTLSTDGYSASIEVKSYVDNTLTNTDNMLYSDYTNIWKTFDDLIRIQYNSNMLSWVVEILGTIEGYNVGDTISWAYNVERNITLEEPSPTPPPPGPGGFDIHLMNNTEELNKITKNPTNVMTLTGTLREETDIVNPEINIYYDGVLVNVNYMYIPIFNRYYFITKIDSIRTGLWRVSAHCDVLKTYADGILNTEAVIARNENKYNLMINDSMFKVYSNPRLQIAKFPQKFEGESYILIMNGAKYTTS